MSGKPTHGLSYTPEYKAWQTMRLRCTVPTNLAYADYGGRGIKVCDRWLNSVAAFIEDMGPKPSPRHELDREDNNGHYEPNNCRWVTRKVNDRNRRSNRFVTFRGESKTMAEWCEILTLPSDTVTYRLKTGWGVEKALTTPVREKAAKGHRKTAFNLKCVDCQRAVSGVRCKSCETRRRNKARALVRATAISQAEAA
jgi:hypothetical protein